MPRSPLDRDDPEASRSEAWLRVFRFILARELARSFHAVRIAQPGLPAIRDDLPLAVYLNHPSWWDGALAPIVLSRLFPARRLYGPIDEDALARYGFMRRLGFFGVRKDSYEGTARFLRIGTRLMARTDTLLGVTPQGGFVDARARPVRLLPGLAALVRRVPRATVLPMAVEYPYWTERLPEALVRFGEPLVAGTDDPDSLVDVASSLERRLEDAQDRLAADATARDAGRFTSLLDGRVGVGGVYDVGRRIKAWSRGERFDAAHAPRVSDRSHG